MRKTAITILFAIISSIILNSCNGKAGFSQSENDSITFDSVKVDSTLFLTEDTAGPRCHVDISITYAKGKNADYINDSIIRSGILIPDFFSISNEKLTVQEAVDSFVSKYVSDYKKDYGEMYRADNAHGISYNCEYVVKTHVDNDNEKYYTYIADTYFYGGGAHGSSFVIVKNINVNTGKIVSLKDIFVPGYEKALCDIIIKKICKKFDAKNLEDLRSKSVFYGIDVYPSQNFIIGEKSITFIYSPDEIAFHAAGEIRVEINNSDIKDILKKQD